MGLRQQAMNQRRIASRERVKQLRKFKTKKEQKARVKALLTRIGNEGRRGLSREVKRVVRHHARNQLRRILPFY